jgi:hypothetical protein
LRLGCVIEVISLFVLVSYNLTLNFGTNQFAVVLSFTSIVTLKILLDFLLCLPFMFDCSLYDVTYHLG